MVIEVKMMGQVYYMPFSRVLYEPLMHKLLTVLIVLLKESTKAKQHRH